MPSVLIDHTFGLLTAMMHPAPTAAISPPPQPTAPEVPAIPELSDEELMAMAEAAEVIEISGDIPAESASSVHLDADDLRLRPRTQPSDLLRQVPGLMVSQHAGGGKADQIFIRGFDADHGTDVAIFTDGVPINLTSHGHGQGYADTHWLIPETVQRIDVHKGPYAARYGDFYTAGAIELSTIDEVGDSTIWVASSAPLSGSMRGKRYDRRLVGMASPRIRDNDGDTSLIALQIAENDGPFVAAQQFRQGNALLKWKGAVGPGELSIASTWYDGAWNQSGQLPEGEIAAGRLDRFGSLDPTEGGFASRSSAQLGYVIRDPESRSSLRLLGYTVSNELELYSNFTLYARDTVHGDQIGQTDDRLLYGFTSRYERSFSPGATEVRFAAGVQFRGDEVETSLFHASQRKRLDMCFGAAGNPCNHTDNSIQNLAAYVETDIVATPRLHVRPGLRVDGFRWAVDDLDPETRTDPTMSMGGVATNTIVSPKLSVELHESEQITVFVNTGSGFHTNDARSAVQDDANGSIARALGAELGTRVKPSERLRIAADVWYLYLTSEQVWSGDAGGTEPSDATRRFGVDAAASLDATAWLSVDGNVTWAHSTFVANQGNGGALALAPRWMGSGGVSVHDTRGFISLRARGIADRPGNEDATLVADGYLLFDVIAGKRLGSVAVELAIANLLDTRWAEAQFAEESRVTPSSELVNQMHLTPGIPLTATLKASYQF